MKRIALYFGLGVAACVPIGCSLDFAFLFPPLEVVDNVDLQRYAGKWYEIAKYPNFFQADCTNATAEYTVRDDGTVGVLNTCISEETGELDTIEGYAEVADPTTNAKLTVFFGNVPFGGAYYIIELDEDYEYAVVGSPSRSFLWILSRTPTMDRETYEGILQRLPDKGYDPGRLELDSEDAVADLG